MNIHTVSELTKLIKGMFDSEELLQNIALTGEISNYKRYPSGHAYFTLKDAKASIKCVMFNAYAKKMKFVPENGIQAVVLGNVSVYERDGVYQMYAVSIEPAGIGDLSAAYEQLKEKLNAEGLFSSEYKKMIPFFPEKIGIVTSSAGAVLRDIYNVSKRRNPSVKLVLYPVKVQGEGSAEQITEAIRFFNDKYPVDVLIVGRGGGSKEDLWSFNEECVVREIFASKIPVISAVGHETDFSLSDFVADVRAATPSQAAELAVPDTMELIRHVRNVSAHLETIKNKQLQEKRNRLDISLHSTFLRQPQYFLRQKRLQLDTVIDSLNRHRKRIFDEKKQDFLLQVERLEILNPLRQLQRGYSIIEKDDISVTSVEQINVDDCLKVTMADGVATVKVESVQKEASA